MDIRLDGRCALITGGSAGLGLAMGRLFASSGARVGLVGRQVAALEKAKNEIEHSGGQVAVCSSDITTLEGCTHAYDNITEALGAPDILINNAGSSMRGPFLSVSDQDWQDDLDLKLFGAVRLSRLVLPHMRAQKWGRIINVLNVAAKMPEADGAPTAVSRAAGMALMKILAHENAPYNVLVNAMLVGKIRSSQWERRHAKADDGSTLEQWYAQQGAKLPMGRLGNAEEFASLACFLASDAGSYISGTAINVDGALSRAV